MDLKEFGKILKEERLRQGLDLSEVMEKTKISRVSLEAIEEGNKLALPHPVYAKGFVKNYARFLGLDADKMGNLLAQIYFSDEESTHEEQEAQLALADARKLPAVRSSVPRWMLVAGAVTVLVLILAGAWFMRAPIQDAFGSLLEKSGLRSQAVSTTVTTTDTDKDQLLHDEASGHEAEGERPGFTPLPVIAPDLGDAPSPLSAPVLPDDVSETDATVDQVEGDEVQDHQQEEQQEVEVSERPSPLESTATAQPGPTEQPEPVNEEVGERTLEIKAFQNCWLSAQADGGTIREAFLRPNERFVTAFEKSLELKLGNAGGVELFLDGRPWPLQANPGEVMVLNFP